MQHSGELNRNCRIINNNDSSDNVTLNDWIIIMKDQHTVAGYASFSGIVYMYKGQDADFVAYKTNK